MISASASALRPRGTTLKGWPALGDVYCNVERRRSWTGFKLVQQRASAARPACSLPTQTSALSGPDTGRPCPLADPARRARDSTGRPKGSRSGSLHLPLDSILTPSYLALVSSERLCPRDRGTPTRAQHPYPWGARGPSPRRLHHRPGRRRLGRLAPARPSLAPGRPGSTGPRTGTGPEGPAQWNAGRSTRTPDARPSRTARKLNRAAGQSRRAARGPGGKRWCQTGKEGGTGSHIRARSVVPIPPTRITAATGPPLKRPPGPGSHCDGPEACSPGEVRAGARSLDGRGRGVDCRQVRLGAPAPSRAPRARPWDRSTRRGCPVTLGLGAVGEGRNQGTRKSGAGAAAR